MVVYCMTEQLIKLTNGFRKSLVKKQINLFYPKFCLPIFSQCSFESNFAFHAYNENLSTLKTIFLNQKNYLFNLKQSLIFFYL